MSKVIYEVILSPDGKHSVSVKSDDPLSLKDALPLAKKIQTTLLEADGVAHPSPTSKTEPASKPEGPGLAQTPLCGVHATPMASMTGKRGSFWSCHKKNADGSWCSYKPKPHRPADGSITVPQLTLT